MLSTLLLSTLAAAAAGPAAAHVVGRGCGGHDMHVARDVMDYHNGAGAMVAKRQSALTDVASLKALGNDERAQCTPYSIPAVSSVQASYPELWATAKIPAADTEARALFQSIEATLNEKLPNATPKPATGAPGSNYSPSDPDCWWTWQGCTTPDPALGIPADLYELPTPQTLALTIDDGPNCSQNAFYEFLREQNQKISVYFIGSNVLIWPLQAQMAHDDGHEICVHTWSHQLMTSLSNEEVFAELYYTRKIIKDVVGVTPRCWRPAQGDVDNRVRVIAAGLNMTNILWTDDTDDWRAQAPGSTVTPADVDTNYQDIINSIGNGTWSTKGSVLLAHQSTNFTMSKLVEWIPRIKAAFTHVVPFASAYNWTTPYAESDIAFPSFEQYINNQSASVPSGGGSGPSGTLSGGSAAPSATGSNSGSGSATGGSSTTGSSPSGTASRSAGAANTTNAAVGGNRVDMGVVGVVVGAVLAWASM